MTASKRIRTVLYGDQRLSGAELEILHTPAMQRLYGLRQLGLTDRIFIDASHARIHHVVGVLHQVDKLISAIESNLKQRNRPFRIGAKGSHQNFTAPFLATFVQKRRPVVRLIGLLHDLTHAPFGHTVEDEIRLVGTKHDEPARQADAFYRLLCQLIAWLWAEVNGPDFKECPELKAFLSQAAEANAPDALKVGVLARRLLSEVDPAKARACWRLSGPEIAEMLAQLGCAMTSLLYLEALHKSVPERTDLPDGQEYPFQAAIRTALSDTGFEHLLPEFEFQPSRDAFMLDIVGNTVCADLLDYAQRDSHFAGLRLDYDSDRIAENFTLVSFDASAYEISHPPTQGGSDLRRSMPEGAVDPFEGWCLRTAISLFSHKYRTDIPSELMNLLNVRFYLYERVIYHPTKCAAGSMLGTALQLLGWRGPATNGKRPNLPAHLRFVGDDVFLHDIRTALDFALGWIEQIEETSRIEAVDLEKIVAMDRVHNGLVPALLRLRIGQTSAEARRELLSSKLMLDRLMARRFFRPVWRALPSSADARLQAGADALADLFRQPDRRYEAERQIEIKAGLPLGTVTIHCPNRKTARKIANVLLTRPGEDGEDEICKLKDIGFLDGPVFGEHQKAVKAVEEMYGSMWRLTVYIAPEHLDRYEEIADASGQVVFKTVDVHGQFEERQEMFWKNDPNLRSELKSKLEPVQSVPTSPDSELGPLGELVGQLSEQLLKSGRLANIPTELFGSPQSLPKDSRARIEKALIKALNAEGPGSDKNSIDVEPNERTERLIQLLRTHIKKPKRDDIADFKRRYTPSLGRLSREGFEQIYTQVDFAIRQTGELDQRGATVHKGNKLNEFREVLDDLLKKQSVAPPSRVKDDLFGGSH
jgi:HD superfamily phosphohydrolase